MPQEPWRRGYELSRMAEQRRREPPPRPSAIPLVAILLTAVVALGVGGYMLWRHLTPAQTEALRVEVVEALPETLRPRAPVSVTDLDSGLGIELRMLESYLEVIAATRGQVEWQLTTTGTDRVRVTAPGVTISTDSARIVAYELELREIFDADVWRDWQTQLTEANISPERTYADAVGADDASATQHHLHGERVQRHDGSWVRPAYELLFEGGRLARIRVGLEYLASETM